jgi:hypothetical protein
LVIHLPFGDLAEMAGNIIPAIATTNAIVAGLIVMQAFRLMNDKLEQCKTVRINFAVREFGSRDSYFNVLRRRFYNMAAVALSYSTPRHFNHPLQTVQYAKTSLSNSISTQK